ncbi:MAG: DNA polymerase/3'-5' exonuclease PolX [Patescibacteria group bacterium]
MSNKEIAKIFHNMALYLEVEGVIFKPQAYERAAMSFDVLSEDIREIYKKEGIKGIRKISGVGESMADKIVEYLEKGKIKEYENFKRKIPIDIEELIAVEGVGPKMIKTLYQKLKIKNLQDLEKAAKSGKIRNLPKFGEKKEQNILQSIEFLKRAKGRYLLGDILPTVKEVIIGLKNIKDVKEAHVVGSLRRMKETIGDVDVLVVAEKPQKVMDYFVSMPGIEKILAKGATKSSVRMSAGFDIDIRVVSEKSYGSALQYFSGSKEHNIALRKIAISKGLKLNEYGLFEGVKMIAGKSEEEIYEKLGMAWIPAELRENSGEIELAQKNKLPELIKVSDIKGDLHVHSDWDGGENSILELVESAIKMDYQYLGIADHTKFLRIENGLDEKRLRERNKEIDKLNFRLRQGFGGQAKFRILKGCEANIMVDGSIDIDDQALKELDFLIAGIHSQLKMKKKEMTSRIIKAMQNPHVDIISHPTGRILQKRDEYEMDFDRILRVAKETKTVLEINSFPLRLDLKDINIKKAKKAGVKMVINTDAHHKDSLRLMEYGVSQARRGWAERTDIVNCWPAEKMLKMLK